MGLLFLLGLIWLGLGGISLALCVKYDKSMKVETYSDLVHAIFIVVVGPIGLWVAVEDSKIGDQTLPWRKK